MLFFELPLSCSSFCHFVIAAKFSFPHLVIWLWPRTAKADFYVISSNGRFVRIAVIGSANMLRSIANVRFGEAAPQRRDRL
jgi:hypothetical protein